MVNVPKAFPLEFRRDVVAVTRRGEAPISRIAKDFGISESCLQRWLKLADLEDGAKPGVTQADAAELPEAKKRIKLLEQENEILRRAAAYLSQSLLPNDVPAGP
jgi:transposase